MRVPLTIVLLCTTCIRSYKILVYIPKFAISHIHFMGKIADTLVDAGHDVTALISEMDASLSDGTKKAKIVRVSPAEGANHMNTHFMEEGAPAVDIFDTHFYTYSVMIENAYHNSVSFCRQCRKLLTTANLVDQLKNEKYDALITEALDNCGVGLSHLIAPRALISRFFHTILRSARIRHSPLAHNGIICLAVLADARFHTSLISRIKSIYLSYVSWSFYTTQQVPMQRVFDELYPGTPSLSHLISNAAVAFANIDPLTDFAHPTLSKIVPIGGITVTKPHPLDKYWSDILSLRNQTVLISFGSIAKSVFMSPARKAALLKAFASFPQITFIWKYEDKSDYFAKFNASKVENVVLTDWMPQLDILADSRLSLFISHAGKASCHEITHFGVPSLLIPIFGDQVHNAAALAHIGVAQVFNKLDMTNSGKVQAAIEEMLGNPAYKETALRIRDQLEARPTSPEQNLVKNVEFAARFGPSKSLRPLNLELTTTQFYGIDIALIVVGSIIFIILAIRYFFLRLRRSLLALTFGIDLTRNMKTNKSE